LNKVKFFEIKLKIDKEYILAFLRLDRRMASTSKEKCRYREAAAKSNILTFGSEVFLNSLCALVD
jgi:hypothetical protein